MISKMFFGLFFLFSSSINYDTALLSNEFIKPNDNLLPSFSCSIPSLLTSSSKQFANQAFNPISLASTNAQLHSLKIFFLNISSFKPLNTSLEENLNQFKRKKINKVTLIWSSATKNYGQITLDEQKRLDQFAQILCAGNIIIDSNEKIFPRDGGSIITALIENDNGNVETFDFLLGTHASTGKECMIIQNMEQNYCADSELYLQLTEMFNIQPRPNVSKHQNAKTPQTRLLPERKKTSSQPQETESAEAEKPQKDAYVAEIVPRMPASEDIWNAAIGADLYAGEYYNNEEEVLCFQVTDIKEAQKRIGKTNPYPYGPWKFVSAKYTLVQLKQAQSILWKNREKLGITSTALSMQNNRLHVNMVNTSKATLEDLVKLTEIKNIHLTKYDPNKKIKLPQDT